MKELAIVCIIALGLLTALKCSCSVSENYLVVGPHVTAANEGIIHPQSLNYRYTTSKNHPLVNSYTMKRGVAPDSTYVVLYRRLYGRDPPEYENGLPFHYPGVSLTLVPQFINDSDFEDEKISL